MCLLPYPSTWDKAKLSFLILLRTKFTNQIKSLAKPMDYTQHLKSMDLKGRESFSFTIFLVEVN